jgi:hypothetical protein
VARERDGLKQTSARLTGLVEEAKRAIKEHVAAEELSIREIERLRAALLYAETVCGEPSSPTVV